MKKLGYLSLAFAIALGVSTAVRANTMENVVDNITEHVTVWAIEGGYVIDGEFTIDVGGDTVAVYISGTFGSSEMEFSRNGRVLLSEDSRFADGTRRLKQCDATGQLCEITVVAASGSSTS